MSRCRIGGRRASSLPCPRPAPQRSVWRRPRSMRLVETTKFTGPFTRIVSPIPEHSANVIVTLRVSPGHRLSDPVRPVTTLVWQGAPAVLRLSPCLNEAVAAGRACRRARNDAESAELIGLDVRLGARGASSRSRSSQALSSSASASAAGPTVREVRIIGGSPAGCSRLYHCGCAETPRAGAKRQAPKGKRQRASTRPGLISCDSYDGVERRSPGRQAK
jgi:hypothetical protein